MKRSFGTFLTRLDETGLLDKIQARALKHHVSLSGLYDGDRSPSVIAARRDVYSWLVRSGKSVNEVARLFDRAPNGVLKLTGRRGN